MSAAPAFVRNGRMDILAANSLGRALYSQHFDSPHGPANSSETFRTRWAAHNVRFHDTGGKRFDHPVVGRLELTFETLELVADPGLVLFVYTAEVGSKSEEALNLLASWTATLDQEIAEA